jgi:hypothetical protein
MSCRVEGHSVGEMTEDNSCTVLLSVRTYVVDSKELMKIPEIAILLEPNRADVANTHETLFRASLAFF